MKLFALAAAGAIALAAARAPRTGRAVPFAVGETLTYDVSWSSYLTAGSATATVADKTSTGGSVAYKIVAEGQPSALVASLYTLHYRIESWLDTSTLLPLRSDFFSQEGSRTRTRTTTFDRKREPIAEDMLSAMYTLRAAPLQPRGRLTIPIIDNGAIYTARFEVREAEPVRCGLGTIAALPIAVTATNQSGEPAGRNLAIWISSDARRLPVKLQGDLAVGRFVLLLRTASGKP
jgi:hypothetical protein